MDHLVNTFYIFQVNPSPPTSIPLSIYQCVVLLHIVDPFTQGNRRECLSFRVGFKWRSSYLLSSVYLPSPSTTFLLLSLLPPPASHLFSPFSVLYTYANLRLSCVSLIRSQSFKHRRRKSVLFFFFLSSLSPVFIRYDTTENFNIQLVWESWLYILLSLIPIYIHTTYDFYIEYALMDDSPSKAKICK